MCQNIKLWIVLLCLIQAVCFGTETEVQVLKGKVRAKTPNEQLDISVGQKGILAEGQKPIISVNDPLVQEAIQLYRWVEAEKAAGNPVDNALIWVAAVDEEQVCRFALLTEYIHNGNEAKSVIQMGPTSALQDLRVYDFEGNLLDYETIPESEHSSTYYIHFQRPIEPGEKIRFITVSPSYKHFFWLSKGPVWSFLVSFGGPRPCLHISKIILPESVILLDAYPDVLLTDEVEDRIALTFRDFVEASRNSKVHISFLWPDKDQTTLQDIPPEMRGIQDPQQVRLIQEYHDGLASIVGGQRFSDISTPMHSLLTCISFIVNDLDRLEIIAASVPFIKKAFGSDLDQAKFFLTQYKEEIIYFVDLQSCGPIPPEPKEGDRVSFTFKYKGTFEPIATIELMYTNDQWIPLTGDFINPPPPSGKIVLSSAQPDLAQATYKNPLPGEFFTRWLFLGPIEIPWEGEGYFPDIKTSKQFFDSDLLNPAAFEPTVRIGKKEYTWALLESETGVINLKNVFDQWYVSAYACAQVEMERETKAVLGIGSDDSVKVWLNGRLVHENWTSRGVVVDQDKVPVTFQKGTNQLIIRVQNGGGPWGFSCRMLNTP